MTAAIQLIGVRVTAGATTILDCIDLTVPAGQTVAVLGPSGSGKSTLLRAVLGLEVPRAGAVHVQGRLVSDAARVLVPTEERELAVVFQDLALWPHLTAAENLAFGLEARGVPREERGRRIGAMLERVQLADKAGRHPGQLSGGERQRIAIARALVMDPVAILFDEPLANLDARLKRELLGEFRALIKERTLSAIYVTHDLREALALADRVVVIEDGRITQEDSRSGILKRPASDFVRQLVGDLASRGEDTL